MNLTKLKKNRVFKFIRENLILFLILLSILIGFGIGIGLKNSSWNKPGDKDKLLWFKLPGSLFIRSLELLIVPVIFIGVVAATSSLSAKSNLRITLICVGLTLLTHILATLTALVGSLILIYSSKKESIVDPNDNVGKQKTTYDIIADILRSLIPKNIIKATTNQEITKFILVNGSYERSVQYIEGTNILGILVFAILIGLSASVLDTKVQVFKDFFKAANDIVILVLRWLILFAPIGIASLIIDAILDVDNLADSFKSIGLFTGLCVAAILFYGIVELALLLFLFTRTNPLKYYYFFLEPMLLAFASTSGAVCIHKSLDICENKIKIDSRIARFGIPFYTTLQADGSAIFIVMSCAFLANYSNRELSAGDFAVIIIMTCILCLCLPSVPSASIITILVVLNAVNFTSPNIAILYTVEWLLDRVRTAINLYSHCFCTVITYELSKKNLNNLVKDLNPDDMPNLLENQSDEDKSKIDNQKTHIEMFRVQNSDTVF
jgi:Na+/H+-dicarboxylate symporter